MKALILLLMMIPINSQAQGLNALAEMDIPIQATRMPSPSLLPPLGADQQVLERLRLFQPPTREGLPPAEGANFDYSGYSTGERIETALQEAEALPRGERIRYLEEVAREIVLDSQPKPHEVFVRIILNRCSDFASLVLPVAGRNTEAVAQWFGNFWTRCLHHSAAYANNFVAVRDYSHFPELPKVMQFYIREYAKVAGVGVPPSEMQSMAVFGQQLGTFFFQQAAKLSSESSQAIILIRTLGYLGWDLNADMRRRHPELVKSVTDIRNIQQSQVYRSILTSLGQRRKPPQGQVAQLRLRVHKLIFDRLPERLRQIE